MKKLVCLLVILTSLPLAAFAQQSASSTTLPLHLGIVLHASRNTFPQQQAAAIEMIQKLVHPGDEAFVVTTGGTKPWPYERIDWDSNPENLVKFVKSLDKAAGLPDAFRYEFNNTSFGADTRFVDEVYSYSPINVFNISVEVMQSDPRPARRVLIMFRDPWNHSPGYSDRYSKVVEHNHDQVILSLKEAGISVFAIGVDEPVNHPKIPAGMNEIYGTLPGQNGGSARVFDQDMERAMNHAYDAGRNNVERITKETGGAIIYGSKKNFTDAVPGIISKVESTSAASGAGK